MFVQVFQNYSNSVFGSFFDAAEFVYELALLHSVQVRILFFDLFFIVIAGKFYSGRQEISAISDVLNRTLHSRIEFLISQTAGNYKAIPALISKLRENIRRQLLG